MHGEVETVRGGMVVFPSIPDQNWEDSVRWNFGGDARGGGT
jgi:hypothetical protein